MLKIMSIILIVYYKILLVDMEVKNENIIKNTCVEFVDT